MIRRVNESDINGIVDVHMRSFPQFFLTFLGRRFLSSYYHGICTDSQGFALVCTNIVDIPIGFVAGSANPRGFYSRMLRRHWFRFVFAAIGPMMRKPSVIKRIARAFFYPSSNPVGNDVAGLFSIAVLPEAQGTGVGKELVMAFLSEAAKRGCTKVFLDTDRDANESVNAFYKKNGFGLKRQFMTAEGRWMNEYWITIQMIESERELL